MLFIFLLMIEINFIFLKHNIIFLILTFYIEIAQSIKALKIFCLLLGLEAF